MTCSMYVDDLLVCCSGKNMATIERQLQLCLNKIHNWSVANGRLHALLSFEDAAPRPFVDDGRGSYQGCQGDEISGSGL